MLDHSLALRRVPQFVLQDTGPNNAENPHARIVGWFRVVVIQGMAGFALSLPTCHTVCVSAFVNAALGHTCHTRPWGTHATRGCSSGGSAVHMVQLDFCNPVLTLNLLCWGVLAS